VMIKIPATAEGMTSITEATAEGISVNVTLIFGLDRYEAVMEAYLAGLEQAQAAGIDLSTIRSVASFFVSRVDTEVDKRLEKIGTDEAQALRGKAAIANARLAYERFEKVLASDRWKALADAGAHVQRPLWASTGVKDPAYDDTMYVVELVAPNTVNTMPEATLDAVADHGRIGGNAITGTYDEARAVLADLEKLGIGYDSVIDVLEAEGVQKFEDSYKQLAESVHSQLDAAGK
jgi:transaldolase